MQSLVAWSAVTLVFVSAVMPAAPASAEEGASARPATKRLCDEDWEGQFLTVVIDKKKYDGSASSLKAFNAATPNEPWQVTSERYLRYKDGYGNVFLHKLLGRFYDRKQAEAFLRKVNIDSGFSRHLNPRYPPSISGPGALLVSDKYTCTLNEENEVLAKANWIVEVDGHLFAGGESQCKQGKKRKTVSVVDCDGKKTLTTDTVETPCEASVHSCLYPLPGDAFAVDHDYSQASEGTTVAIRAYDLKKKRQVYSAEETNDGDADTTIVVVDDVDGDGVPEIVHRVAGTGQIVSQLKWRNHQFVKAGR
jgi:hypothetical protein